MSEYPQVKAFALNRNIIEENYSTKTLRKWIYSVKKIQRRSEKYKGNDIRSFCIDRS